MSAEVPPKRRGRPPRPEPATPIGYRVTERTRRHLAQAEGFLGVHSAQEVIDMAVREFLVQLRERDADYAVAAEALDRVILRGQDNVEPLRKPPLRRPESDAEKG